MALAALPYYLMLFGTLRVICKCLIGFAEMFGVGCSRGNIILLGGLTSHRLEFS